ncbi:MAG: citrate (Si)-synthase, partial [Rhodospirillaceae bacterium]|nr:citrate (Si)-synthase [Rhodospirillales bacterium]
MTNNAEKRDSVTLINNSTGKTTEYPLLSGSVGPKVMDIRSLYSSQDIFTYDPGYTSTGSCKSAITYIDGDEGVLLHRGYAIADLAENCEFLEVAYAILKGELPNVEQKAKFESDITHHSMLNEQMSFFFRGFRRDSHPMAVM